VLQVADIALGNQDDIRETILNERLTSLLITTTSPLNQIRKVVTGKGLDKRCQISSILLSAHGLTEGQARVGALVLRAHSTRQIVRELHISANTVQEHLTATFDKFGVRSRRELVAAVLSGHH